MPAELIYEDADGREVSLIVDATVSEEHAADALVTRHPVDRGVDATDHVRPELRTVRLEVHVSNTPVRQPVGLAGGAVLAFTDDVLTVTSRSAYTSAGAKRSVLVLPPNARAGQDPAEAGALGAESLRFGVRTQTPDRQFDRVRLFHRTMVAHRAKGTVFRLVTFMETYERMVLTGVRVPHDVESGDAATFSLNFRELRVGRVEFAENAPEPVERRGNPPKERGKKPTEEATEQEEESNASWLAQLTGLD